MKISEIYEQKNKRNQTVISLEIFPPKTLNGEKTIFDTVTNLTKKPDYISVTYRDVTGDKTREIASKIKQTTGVEVLHHLTCVQKSQGDIDEILNQIKEANIQNILALHGDYPKNQENYSTSDEYPLAKHLISDIKKRACFSVGAAAYPEGHVDSNSISENIDHLRQKYEAGTDFFISQLFFDNDKFYRLNEAAKTARIACPLAAGIMPIMSAANIERLIFFGASIPTNLIKIINKYKESPEDLRKAGLEYAFKQVDDLIAHGVDGVHLYTMNRPSVANEAMERYL
ncbi:methylenetetrahydrofolate reductase [Lactococcus kimchii]|uniref:methylenetetrahydrofolate reductase n=1 Tax=Lactococcus sp. S-13 TaxID=2507158 RepID=UPI00102336DD|nr:methylenetetrahydrofolate reductase [Lactococcus sp. S-13]RZI48648.1 methylenetetrahydrofolate reductase [NAD(P)H] [Lactococcus sp. S-13]